MKKNTRREFISKSMAAIAAASIAGNVMGSVAQAVKSTRPIHAFTKCLQFLDYNEMAELLARNGFDGADLTVRPKGQVLPENVKKDLPTAYKALHDAGISTDMIATNISDPNNLNTKAILQTMSDLGIRYYRLGYLSYDNKISVLENFDNHKRTFEELENLNRIYGVTGCYQNHSGSKVGGPVWDLYHLLKDCDPVFMGVQYDIRHATVEGAMSWPIGIKLLAPWIKTTDIKDFIWVKNKEDKWKLKYVPLGMGMVSFKDYFDMYKALKIDGPISIHYEYDLGGAEHGDTEITMSQEKIETFMKEDLAYLKRNLLKYDL